MMDLEPALNDLAEWAGQCELVLSQARMAQLRIYIERLMLWNSRVALVSQTAPREIVCKHFADSLFAARSCRNSDRIIDLGSGAGFPGLVIAIAVPEATVCLVEARRKKASFLNEVIAAARVNNARAVEARIERLSAEEQHRRCYTVAFSRALSGLVEFLRFARPLLCDHGRAIAMKGPRHGEELIGLNPRDQGFTQPDVMYYILPDGSERCLLDFKLAGSERTPGKPG
jgi:16S rRNA (guanine527-N7)-methyltransferase